ncbi:LGFP repeat-containing protein [Prescottella subtropica]|uniref:LGFP repeat-containing protein n=1 Tax=Prescottella subtropica TaxID=2545757 RepID=UPI0013869157|nr:hypothetical protein [Prescottella subtropica]
MQRTALPEGVSQDDAELAERMAMVVADNCQFYGLSPFAVCGAIRDKYNAMGGPASFLGYPTSPEYQNPGATGYRSEFLNGSIYWSAATGAHPVTPLYMTKWNEHGWEAGWMGYPTTDEFRNLDNVGSRQEFQGAAMYWHPLHSPLLGVIGGAIRDKWNTVGAENGPLGYPNSNETPVIKNNGRYNNFSNGTITWSIPTGARLLYAPIRDRWAASGREDGPSGYPLTDEQVTPDNIGHFARFEGGDAVYWTQITGAWNIPPDLLNKWGGLGFETSEYGYPTWVAVQDAAGGWVQEFQYGMLQTIGDFVYESEKLLNFDLPGIIFEGEPAYPEPQIASDLELEPSNGDFPQLDVAEIDESESVQEPDAQPFASSPGTTCKTVTGEPHNSEHRPGTINVAMGVRCAGDRAAWVSGRWGLYREGVAVKIAPEKKYTNVRSKNWGAGVSLAMCIPGEYRGLGYIQIQLKPGPGKRNSGWMRVEGPPRYIDCKGKPN